MQSIKQQRYNNYEAYLLSSNELELTVVPDLGALPVSLKHTKLGEIFALCPDDELASDGFFRSRILFPFNDRIPEGKYTFEGQEYQLPINEPSDGSSIHGLVYDKTFSVKPYADDTGVLELHYSFKSMPSYPFDLDFSVRYELEASRLKLAFNCLNTGSRKAPVALGWHPYFLCPQGVDTAVITVNADTFVPVGEDLLPTGKFESVDGTDFNFKKGKIIGKEELDIALGPVDKQNVRLETNDRCVDVAFDGEFFRFWQFFVPPDRMSVAIEPITSPTNAFNEPELGLKVLEAGKELKGNVFIDIKEV